MTEDAPDRTIEQLAQEFDLPVSTLRMYQHRGLLPPPERRGRVAYYGRDHLARLRMLTTLQERGFSLAAIKELLDGWQEGRTLDDVLGLGGSGSVWAREEPAVVDLPDLVGRFPSGIEPELVQRAAAAGLVAVRDDGRIEITRPRNLDLGSRLVALGLPPDEVIGEYEVLRRHCDELAGRFTDLFRRHLWPGLLATDGGPEKKPGGAAAVPPPERLEDVRRALDELGGLALEVVDATLRHAIQDAAQGFLDEQAEALAAGTGAPRPKAGSSDTPSRNRTGQGEKARARRPRGS
jgi:DNA-binding transcriptional MerR regulator